MTKLTRTPGTSSSWTNASSKDAVKYFLIAALCYYIGSFTATSMLQNRILQMEQDMNNLQKSCDQTKAELSTAKADVYDMQMATFAESKLKNVKEEKLEKIVNSHHPRFTKKVPFMGMAKTSKKEFTASFDFGSPVDDLYGNDVLLFYNDKSIPKGLTYEEKENIINNSGSVQTLDPKKATNNCKIMHVATIPNNESSKQSCLAVVNNFGNQFLQKWMRNDLKDPLRIATRGQNERSRVFRPPEENDIKKHWKMLRTYLNSVDDVVEELKPIAKKVSKDNTIIVMTCNMGQSELLMNFVCNAKAKGLDVSNILVFPTDAETKELAEGLGLVTYHDSRNFGELPKGEARNYGDRNFVAMMFAKVVCVQLINHLGYDLLFQDVDIVWYKNPLDYFHDKKNPYYDFDMYFQDDGAHSDRYAPYSANSGFYYVRNNAKTRYLFTSLLYHNDIIIESASHQQALIQLLADHASLYGMRVKVLSRDMKDFPGGWHYHRKKDFMKEILKGEVVPQIFHMSWTQNKKNKLRYFQQMGQWYLHDKCIGKTVDGILGVNSEEENGNSREKKTLFEPCCLAEANVVCHYRDKPSKVPCRDKDPIDKGRPSFW